MPREFELRKETSLDASPDEVWDAIATGPGISSWFMGPHQVEPGVGGRITLDIGDFSEASTITAWDPPHRLAYRGDPAPDGTFHAMEYLVEGRDGGSTVLRFVHSGVLGDDWGEEYEDQTSHGWDMYLHTLGEYLRHFRGRPGTYVYAHWFDVPEGRDAWALLTGALGLSGPAAVGDRVRLTPEGLAPIEGVVDYARPDQQAFLGVRGSEGMYRFFGGAGHVAVGHHLFGEGVDAKSESESWRAWLGRVFAS
ncbi:putative conserved protein YndB, AHSA1/START domain [Streptoalloteichus tenebrarius]|uniref:Conserved protein YndB, AHSA1/START domain n=1 Tax=Streptoalloteichus tenebrarius (strain ATCC 17920 / DSM 40477 / JCM 4838 / CBS 697.72 / NBRC 16177 / NCIMB 11028 / NRRL B-12390 / A12253. 1 / ISP 5477) TaxID=1933 RepID=A0ABT1HUL0_STRSD|nr:SRPBCC domain-containing protein [Streptoalloteichus tenebrarius]MCP2259197.1 putative conserved protein YndB, AHSA1/START domain [Streptoalloteichus tenebrarius]BFF04322.1 SRPBCC domain-containing protein [Streptoalloteichus tenebrarius]